MKYKFFHRTNARLPLVVTFGCIVAGCELPPEEILEPDIHTVTLLFTGSIRGELHICD
jgi:hypothetical protein